MTPKEQVTVRSANGRQWELKTLEWPLVVAVSGKLSHQEWCLRVRVRAGTKSNWPLIVHYRAEWPSNRPLRFHPDWEYCIHGMSREDGSEPSYWAGFIGRNWCISSANAIIRELNVPDFLAKKFLAKVKNHINKTESYE